MSERVEIVQAEGFTLSRLIWRLLGRQPARYTEIVLEANPHLMHLDALLPIGTRVVFPIDKVPVEEPQRKAVRLWD